MKNFVAVQTQSTKSIKRIFYSESSEAIWQENHVYDFLSSSALEDEGRVMQRRGHWDGQARRKDEAVKQRAAGFLGLKKRLHRMKPNYVILPGLLSWDNVLSLNI